MEMRHNVWCFEFGDPETGQRSERVFIEAEESRV